MGKAEIRARGSDGVPPVYPLVVADILAQCCPAPGLWIDLGCGDGGVGLELARACTGTVLLIDPDGDALRRAAARARQEFGRRRHESVRSRGAQVWGEFQRVLDPAITGRPACRCGHLAAVRRGVR